MTTFDEWWYGNNESLTGSVRGMSRLAWDAGRADLQAENARLSAELAAFREAMGPVGKVIRSLVSRWRGAGWMRTEEDEMRTFRAAVAAFDRAGEKAPPANLSSATVHGDDATRKGG